jgi:hypothetical protein
MTPLIEALAAQPLIEVEDMVKTFVGNELFRLAVGTKDDRARRLAKLKKLEESPVVAALSTNTRSKVLALIIDCREMIKDEVLEDEGN